MSSPESTTHAPTTPVPVVVELLPLRLMDLARRLRQEGLTIQAVDENSVTLGRVLVAPDPDAEPRGPERPSLPNSETPQITGHPRPRPAIPQGAVLVSPEPVKGTEPPLPADLLTLEKLADTYGGDPAWWHGVAVRRKLPLVLHGGTEYLSKAVVDRYLANQSANPTNLCENCGAEFPCGPRHLERFCSTKCRPTARKKPITSSKHPEALGESVRGTIPCARCGRDFAPMKHWQRFCTPKCRIADTKTRRKASRRAAKKGAQDPGPSAS